jgi:hypothetical protein
MTTGEPMREHRITVDREIAVRRLLDLYAHACDTADVELLVSLFGSGGEVRVRGESKRGDDLRAYYAPRIAVPSLHFTTGLTVSERADGLVDATCGFFAIEMPSDRWRGVAGRYTDVIDISDGADGAARFVSRSITTIGQFSGIPD